MSSLLAACEGVAEANGRGKPSPDLLHGAAALAEGQGRREAQPLPHEVRSLLPQDSGRYPDTWHSTLYTSVRLTPGFDEPREDCGVPSYVVRCPTNRAHLERIYTHHCDRAACPVCWPKWAMRQTRKAAEALEAYRELRGKRAVRHISLSPGQKSFLMNEYDPKTLQALYSYARDMAKVLGVEGGVVVAHPYRFRSKELREQASSFAWKAGDSNPYIWAMKQDSWREWVYFSPHVHMLVYGRLMDAAQFHTHYDCVYRNHDPDGNGREGDALRATIFYILSHAWALNNHKIVRYWFGMSTHKLKRVDDGERIETEKCDKCGAELVKADLDRDGVEWQVKLYERKVKIFHFELRGSKKKSRLRASSRIQIQHQLMEWAEQAST